MNLEEVTVDSISDLSAVIIEIIEDEPDAINFVFTIVGEGR